jgi:predicted ATPase
MVSESLYGRVCNIGRDSELLEIERLVMARRLVTLTGAGGSGKTRLAVQLGSRMADRWPDGFWLVDLGSVTDPDLIARTTATALRVLLEPGGDRVRTLAARLSRRRMLVCLDTCEHLLDAAAALTDTVLRACPEVTVLATCGSALQTISSGSSGVPVHTTRLPSSRTVVTNARLTLVLDAK